MTIVVPSSTSICSKARMWPYRFDQRALGTKFFHPDDQDVLIVGPIEHADVSLVGRRGVDAPEIVVGGSPLPAGTPKLVALTAGRIDPGEDRANRPVLAGGVDRLQDDQHAALLLGEQHGLQLAQPLEDLDEFGLGCLLLPPEGLVRLPTGQRDALARLHP